MKEAIFKNCNVCGRQLVRQDELAIGMCAICANEEVPDETKNKQNEAIGDADIYGE